jgi:hypothetical protein
MTLRYPLPVMGIVQFDVAELDEPKAVHLAKHPNRQAQGCGLSPTASFARDKRISVERCVSCGNRIFTLIFSRVWRDWRLGTKLKGNDPRGTPSGWSGAIQRNKRCRGPIVKVVLVDNPLLADLEGDVYMVPYDTTHLFMSNPNDTFHPFLR